MSKLYTTRQVIDLFRIEKTRTTIYRDEAAGLIPTASRVKRGSSFVRAWKLSDLPAIGKYYGFLKPPQTTKVITVYTPKGGVLKSTLSFNLSRLLALNGIKTLVIGLDVTATVTNNFAEKTVIESLDDIKDLKGLYEASRPPNEGGCSIEETILPTDLPTLDYIPESSTLNQLEERIREKQQREFVLKRLIKPLYGKYQVILFDNSPSWTFLIRNSLAAATDIISPIACDTETFRALAGNIQMINDFKLQMELEWNSFTLIPTKVERTKLSQLIEAKYQNLFTDLISFNSIRHAATGQESSSQKLSVIEYDNNSALASDYYEVIKDVWHRINHQNTNSDLQEVNKAQ